MSAKASVLTITRDPMPEDPEAPTMGTMEADGLIGSPLATLEPPWRDNRVDVSCIPEGDYVLVFLRSPKFEDALMPHLLAVPGRTEVMIHVGNYPVDTKGCILVGMERGVDDRSIRRSGVALGLVVGWLRRAVAGGAAVCRVERASGRLEAPRAS